MYAKYGKDFEGIISINFISTQKNFFRKFYQSTRYFIGNFRKL